MKKIISLIAVAVCGLVLLASPAQAAGPARNLDDVLRLMDDSSRSFRTVETDFVWDQYQRVVNETDSQKGTMYFRRSGQHVDMAAKILPPDEKYVLFTGGDVQVYQPRIDQVTKYAAGKNRDAFESFLVLGFGGSGHDLLKSFNVKFTGTERVVGVDAYRLVLVPKSDRVRNMFNVITLWIDPVRGVSVQQRFDQSSGDYRLARYTNIRLNAKLPDGVFKLKTTSKTKYISPRG